MKKKLIVVAVIFNSIPVILAIKYSWLFLLGLFVTVFISVVLFATKTLIDGTMGNITGAK